MLFADGALGLLLIGLWLFCIFDVITTPEIAMKHLPKLVWLFLVLILPDVGSVIWLVAGRDRAWKTSRPSRASTAGFPEYDRPGRAVAANPDDDEAFLRGLRERADSQRQAYEARRRAERAEEEARLRRRPEES
jgi:hypothetical protein